MRRFDFEGITPRLPTETFTGRRELRVGDRAVELIELGPAHTPTIAPPLPHSSSQPPLPPSP